MGFSEKFSIQFKLMLMMLAVSISSILLISLIGYAYGTRAIQDSVVNHLITLRNSKEYQIEAYFNIVRGQVQTLSEDRMIVEAAQEFTAAFKKLHRKQIATNQQQELLSYYQEEFMPRLKQNIAIQSTPEAFFPRNTAAIYLQHTYIATNPYSVEEKELLHAASDETEYSSVHQKYHTIFHNFVETFGYYDMFLVDAQTKEIVYSVEKETDLGTSLTNGVYASSSLAQAVNDAYLHSHPGYIAIADFQPYLASYGKPQAFIASPIFDNSKLVGLLALQLPIDEINSIMTNNRNWKEGGLGDTGEIFLVGPDYTMRSISRFLIEDPKAYLENLQASNLESEQRKRIDTLNTSVLHQDVKTESANQALINKKSGVLIAKNYRGHDVLSAYTPLDITSLNWAMIAEIQLDEAAKKLQTFKWGVFTISALLITVIAFLSLLLSRIFLKPIRALMRGVNKISTGDIDVRVKIKSGDELQELSEAFNDMANSIKQQRELLQRKNLLRITNLKTEKERIRYTFGRYVSDEVVTQLLTSPEALKLGGERKKITILNSDLRGFTAISERLPPEEVVKILNFYLSHMADVITSFNGTIDEFMGDGILVLFGAPISREDDAARAVACAVAMQLAMQSVNNQIKKWCFSSLEMGIGINTGEVVVGNIGSEKRTKYGIVGNEVNLTYRIESYTIGNQILISESTLNEVDPIVRIDGQKKVQPKGVKEPITIYEIGGIRDRYNLFLEKKEEIFYQLEEQIPLKYTILEGKHIGDNMFDGCIIELSLTGARIGACKKRENTTPLALTNVKLNLLEIGNPEEISDDIYAKVLDKSSAEGSFYVHFTSKSPELAKRLEILYYQAQKFTLKREI